MMEQPYIVIVGSCMTDLTSYAPRLPTPGETIHGHKFTVGFGGKGANQCIAAARMGARTAMVAKLGSDSFGDNYLANLADNGVDISHVSRTDDAATGIAAIVVDEKGQNCIIILGGANQKLTMDDVTKAENLISQAALVVTQGEISWNVTHCALSLARKHRVPTMLNVAPAPSDFDKNVLASVDIVCVNESEAEIMTGIKVACVADARVAAEKLLSFGCREVAVTMGADGAVLVTSDSCCLIPTAEVLPVDTTGAGDAFVGALAYYMVYHSHLNREEMMKRACEVATLSVCLPGTQTSYAKKEGMPQKLYL